MDKDKQKTSLETWNSEELGKMNQNATNAAPGAATTSQEAPEEGFQAKTVYEGGLDAEGSETAAQGPREGVSEGEGDAPEPENDFLKESEQKQAEMPGKEERKTKRSLMVLVLLLVLTVAAVAVWWFWGHREEEQRQDGSTGQVETGPSEEQKPETELVELSVDDELVQRLYGQFEGIFYGVPFLSLYGDDIFTDFYSDSPITNRQMWAVAMLNTKEVNPNGVLQPEQCEVSSRIFGEDLERQVLVDCYPVEEIQANAKKIFGREIDLDEFRGRDGQMFGTGIYIYSEEHEAFLQASGAGTYWTDFLRGLYKAEKDAEHVYLYEVVVIERNLLDEDYYEQTGGMRMEYLNVERDPLWPSDELELTKENLIEHKDKLDKFKWAFVWNGENYVFEKLEKIQD